MRQNLRPTIVMLCSTTLLTLSRSQHSLSPTPHRCLPSQLLFYLLQQLLAAGKILGYIRYKISSFPATLSGVKVKKDCTRGRVIISFRVRYPHHPDGVDQPYLWLRGQHKWAVSESDHFIICCDCNLPMISWLNVPGSRSLPNNSCLFLCTIMNVCTTLQFVLTRNQSNKTDTVVFSNLPVRCFPNLQMFLLVAVLFSCISIRSTNRSIHAIFLS